MIPVKCCNIRMKKNSEKVCREWTLLFFTKETLHFCLKTLLRLFILTTSTLKVKILRNCCTSRPSSAYVNVKPSICRELIIWLKKMLLHASLTKTFGESTKKQSNSSKLKKKSKEILNILLNSIKLLLKESKHIWTKR